MQKKLVYNGVRLVWNYGVSFQYLNDIFLTMRLDIITRGRSLDRDVKMPSMIQTWDPPTLKCEKDEDDEELSRRLTRSGQPDRKQSKINAK